MEWHAIKNNATLKSRYFHFQTGRWQWNKVSIFPQTNFVPFVWVPRAREPPSTTVSTPGMVFNWSTIFAMSVVVSIRRLTNLLHNLSEFELLVLSIQASLHVQSTRFFQCQRQRSHGWAYPAFPQHLARGFLDKSCERPLRYVERPPPQFQFAWWPRL